MAERDELQGRIEVALARVITKAHGEKADPDKTRRQAAEGAAAVMEVLPAPTPDHDALAQVLLEFLRPPKHGGGSWTYSPYEAADAVTAWLDEHHPGWRTAAPAATPGDEAHVVHCNECVPSRGIHCAYHCPEHPEYDITQDDLRLDLRYRTAAPAPAADGPQYTVEPDDDPAYVRVIVDGVHVATVPRHPLRRYGAALDAAPAEAGDGPLLRGLVDRVEALCQTGVFDVNVWGERGTPFSNGGARAFAAVQKELDAAPAEPGDGPMQVTGHGCVGCGEGHTYGPGCLAVPPAEPGDGPQECCGPCTWPHTVCYVNGPAVPPADQPSGEGPMWSPEKYTRHSGPDFAAPTRDAARPHGPAVCPNDPTHHLTEKWNGGHGGVWLCVEEDEYVDALAVPPADQPSAVQRSREQDADESRRRARAEAGVPEPADQPSGEGEHG